MSAAFILLLSVEGRVLFLKRAPGDDMGRRWDFPGGGVEDGEGEEEAALRELEEETGISAEKRHLTFLTRVKSDWGNEAVTYIVRQVEEFRPDLDDEHTQFIWREPDQPPQVLHPACQIALDRLGWDELDVARAMSEGVLYGPQPYENIVLFKLRITGTGQAFRNKWSEWVQRDPGLYLNDDFLARCNGLPVIMEHPKGDVLNSEEFKDRVIGTILLPYIEGDEVWGIAKIYDAQAARIMQTEQLSTSPAVAWRDPDVNQKFEDRDGRVIMFEGKPSMLDHLAVCRGGVWDKGGPPSGVETALLAADLAQAEARMDQALSRVDSVEERMIGLQVGQLLQRVRQHTQRE